MKLSTAIATAKQQIDPEFKGPKWPDSGIYRAANGQYMTGPRDNDPGFTWRTFEQFVKDNDE